MEPMNDRELNQLLQEWKAPGAPPHLRPPARSGRDPWWRWFVTGTIRVPVPVGLMLVALVASLWVYAASRQESAAGTETPASQPVVSLADFQPVKEVELRVVGEGQ